MAAPRTIQVYSTDLYDLDPTKKDGTFTAADLNQARKNLESAQAKPDAHSEEILFQTALLDEIGKKIESQGALPYFKGCAKTANDKIIPHACSLEGLSRDLAHRAIQLADGDGDAVLGIVELLNGNHTTYNESAFRARSGDRLDFRGNTEFPYHPYRTQSLLFTKQGVRDPRLAGHRILEVDFPSSSGNYGNPELAYTSGGQLVLNYHTLYTHPRLGALKTAAAVTETVSKEGVYSYKLRGKKVSTFEAFLAIQREAFLIKTDEYNYNIGEKEKTNLRNIFIKRGLTPLGYGESPSGEKLLTVYDHRDGQVKGLKLTKTTDNYTLSDFRRALEQPEEGHMGAAKVGQLKWRYRGKTENLSLTVLRADHSNGLTATIRSEIAELNGREASVEFKIEGDQVKILSITVNKSGDQEEERIFVTEESRYIENSKRYPELYDLPPLGIQRFEPKLKGSIAFFTEEDLATQSQLSALRIKPLTTLSRSTLKAVENFPQEHRTDFGLTGEIPVYHIHSGRSVGWHGVIGDIYIISTNDKLQIFQTQQFVGSSGASMVHLKTLEGTAAAQLKSFLDQKFFALK